MEQWWVIKVVGDVSMAEAATAVVDEHVVLWSLVDERVVLWSLVDEDTEEDFVVFFHLFLEGLASLMGLPSPSAVRWSWLRFILRARNFW